MSPVLIEAHNTQSNPKTPVTELNLDLINHYTSLKQRETEEAATGVSLTNDVVVVSEDEDMERVVETPNIWESSPDAMHQ